MTCHARSALHACILITFLGVVMGFAACTPTPTPTPTPIPTSPPSFIKARFDGQTSGDFTLNVDHPFASPNGLAFAGLRNYFSDDSDMIWPIHLQPFALTQNRLHIFGPNDQVFDFKHTKIDCEAPENGSIGAWDLSTQSREILYSRPLFFVESAHILPNGHILICHAEYPDTMPACDITIENYGIREPPGNTQLARFDPIAKTLTPLPLPPELNTCKFLFSAPAARLAFEGESAYHVVSLSDDNKTLLSIDDGDQFVLSPNGQFIAFLQLNDSTENAQFTQPTVYDVNTGALLITSPLPGDHNRLHPIFSPNSKRVAFFHQPPDKPLAAHIFDVDSKSLISSLDIDLTYQATFSPDGLFLLTTYDTEIRIFDIKSQKILKTLTEHTQLLATHSLAFSADAKTLFSAQHDGITFAWDWTAISASLSK